MANIKKYNPDSQNWETWASNSATGVYSDNPVLLPEEENEITVEDALIRDREDIELMKKNISWLALHGGRGGGGTYVDVTNPMIIYDSDNNIVYNSEENIKKSIIWKPKSNGIYFSISSSKTSNKFDVTVILDGARVYEQKGIPTQSKQFVRINNLKSTDTGRHTLQIWASDSFDNLVDSGIIDITELSLSITDTGQENTVDINEIFQNSVLNVNCKTTVPGSYVLYWGLKSDIDTNPDNRQGSKQLDIWNTANNTVSIPYWSDDKTTRLLPNNEITIGQTLRFYFLLVSANGESMRSDVKEIRSIITSPTDLAIKPLSLSTEINNITEVSKAGILNSNFIVYLSTGNYTYNYEITVNKLEYNENTSNWDVVGTYPNLFRSGSGRYGVQNVVMHNTLQRDDFFEGNCVYEFVIFARDTMELNKTGRVSTYVKIQPVNQDLIDLGQLVNRRTIFDFNIRESSPVEPEWTWTYTNDNFNFISEDSSVTTVANLYNMGGKSKIETTHCRLTNKAYMIINRSSLNGQPISWFPSNANSSHEGLVPVPPQFTLSLRYYNDYTPSDNKTVFNFGNYIPKTSQGNATGKGILINNHDFYIQLGGESSLIHGKIQDSIYHEIDIVFGRGNDKAEGNTTVEVYHNGVLTAYGNHNTIEDLYTWSGFNEMSLACYKNANGTISQNTNIKLQGISLYGTALNPYQVVCNYINNLVVWDLDNGVLNEALLNKKMLENMISYTEVDGVKKYECAIWDDREGHTFKKDSWIDQDLSGKLTPRAGLKDVCPIPIVILDFSATNWVWDNFIRSWENSMPEPVTVPMYYFKDHSSGEPILNGTYVTVSGQGTTSRSYGIKNLDIDFGENNLFWAKQDWFPERIYTLKADIVDSAHANNATIGRFINTCAQSTTLLEPTPPMTYFNANKNTSVFENLPVSALGEGGLTIKHTLEGFPILLLVRFPGEDNSTISKSLGIYSFNLGRGAIYNMGFEVLKTFRDTNQNILSSDANAPMLLGRVDESSDVIKFDAESWEGLDSFNCTTITDPEATAAEIISISGQDKYETSLNATAPVQLDGYFWSSYPDHIRHFWQPKYPSQSVPITKFLDLCTEIVGLPYTKGSFSTGDRGEMYQYSWNGSKMYVPEQSRTLVGRTNKSDTLFNRQNAIFYYVVCMLFGLVDSLGKNLNMRIWNKNDIDSKWYTCFYDMDTALGVNNVGVENIQPDVCDEILRNDRELKRDFISYSTEKLGTTYTVKDNKLWGALDDRSFKDQFYGNNIEGQNSLYALAWSAIRTNYLKSADDFMNLYFNNQIGDIGEIIYNQDFDVKYLNTQESRFMYGDRKAFVKDWITKRIQFLDGYFGDLQARSGGNSPYLESTLIKDCSYKNKVTISHMSGTDYLPVVSSSPCILTTIVGNEANRYTYYLPANEPVDVRMANSINTQGIQTWINNSDLLLEIKNLSNLAINSFKTTESGTVYSGSGDELYTKQLGTFSSFNKFDVNGNTTFIDNGIDFIKLFKTWNNGENTLPYSLTELNLSNTKSSSIQNFPLNLRNSIEGPRGETFYQNPFENLTDIDIRNSCVTNVILPRNIALHTLQIAGSGIQKLSLEGQSVLKTIDFTGCNALETIELYDCAAFETFNISGTPNLHEIHVARCPSLHTITINMNSNDVPVDIAIEQCDGLKRLTILNVINGNTTVSIDAAGLEEINMAGCQFSSFKLTDRCQENLKFLDISQSSINIINWNGNFDGDYLDLSECPYLINGGINMANNLAIEKIQLPNNNDPVPLNFSFSGCVNLTRIYGNIELTKSGMFSGCRKFTVQGGKFKDSLDINAAPKSVSAGTYLTEGTDMFQTGKEVTNLTINIESPTSMFSGTAVDDFDVYYILRHLGPNVKNISRMFLGCPNIKMNIDQGFDRSPHWTMFDNSALDENNICQLTDISYLFYDCNNMGPFRLYGNHVGEYNDAHQGLFTPLVKCTNFTYVFGRGSWGQSPFICDLNVFKLPGNQTYGNGEDTVSITNFRPLDVYVDLNKMSTSEVRTAINNPNDFSLSTKYTRGILKGIFDSFYKLPNSLSHVLHGLRHIDFGSDSDPVESSTFTRIPLNVTSLESCFNVVEGTSSGIIQLQRLFTRNPYSEDHEFLVTSISNCFDATDDTVWYLDNSSLNGFVNLKVFSSVCTGVKKVISGDQFPYDIFDPFRDKIENLSGFFSNVQQQDTLQMIQLPGTLFHDCTNLKSINRCFEYFNIPFELNPNGFETCHNLEDVSYLFYRCTTCNSCIPNNFFNIGFIESSETVTGATIDTKTINIPPGASTSWIIPDFRVVVLSNGGTTRTTYRYRNVEVEDDVITYNPTSMCSVQVENDNGNGWIPDSTLSHGYEYISEYNEWAPRTEEITKRLPRRKINNMSNLLIYSNFPTYTHKINWDLYTAGGDIEPNPEYSPFEYVYTNNTWVKVGRNAKKKTIMWSFDGDWGKLKTINEDPNSDIPVDIDINDFYIPDEQPLYTKSSSGSGYFTFGCPPDLFRWCSQNPNISTAIGWINFKGRIPPYLLKAVPDIRSISSLFSHTSGITAYSDQQNQTTYITIPRTFLSYTPNLTDLSSTFAYCTLYANPDYAFTALRNNSLNVSSIFHGATWPEGIANSRFAISNVFANNKIQKADNAFSADIENSSRTQYLTFSSVFSTDPTKFDKQSATRVFYGYVRGNANNPNVQHEPGPTCSIDPNNENYKYYEEIGHV